MEEILNLKGKRAVVTGGAMGIGFGIVERLVWAGADVLIVDLDGDQAAHKAEALSRLGSIVVAMAMDVSAEDAGEAIVAEAVTRLGGIDILINNAGIFPQVPMLDMQRSLFDKIMRINVYGLAYISREVAKQMILQGTGGKIVNIGSIDSFHPSMVGLTAYDTSKGAVRMFNKAFALEVAPHNIQVNLVAPGGVATEGTAAPLQGSGMTSEQQKQIMEGFIATIPMKRIGVPDDIAKVVLMLSSSASNYMTGSEIVVDGGALIS